MFNTSDESDEKLVKRVQAGDSSALPKLVNRWHKEFCNKAYWLTKDRDLSKDIAQDSWKDIIAKINDLKDPQSFKSWAFRIVFSKSFDVLRYNQRKRMELNSYATNLTEDEEELVDHSDLKKKLIKDINGLPEQQQAVLRLFYVEEYSIREISKLLDISVGTIKSRLFHAREKLKRTIKK